MHAVLKRKTIVESYCWRDIGFFYLCNVGSWIASLKIIVGDDLDQPVAREAVEIHTPDTANEYEPYAGLSAGLIMDV